MSEPAPEQPDVADPVLWGPYLLRLRDFDWDAFLDALRGAQELFMVTLRDVVPHGTYARVSRWALEGQDPGPPRCACGCGSRVAEA